MTQPNSEHDGPDDEARENSELTEVALDNVSGGVCAKGTHIPSVSISLGSGIDTPNGIVGTVKAAIQTYFGKP
jgi:hypothetical protein